MLPFNYLFQYFITLKQVYQVKKKKSLIFFKNYVIILLSIDLKGGNPRMHNRKIENTDFVGYLFEKNTQKKINKLMFILTIAFPRILREFIFLRKGTLFRGAVFLNNRPRDVKTLIQSFILVACVTFFYHQSSRLMIMELLIKTAMDGPFYFSQLFFSLLL